MKFSMFSNSVGHNSSNMEHYHDHDHRHKKIRSRVVLPLVATILLLPLTESRSLRGGCEEEFSSKEQTRNMTRGDQEDLLTFTLLHVNDIHSHFEEVNVNTGTCKVKLSNPPLPVLSLYYTKALHGGFTQAANFCPALVCERQHGQAASGARWLRGHVTVVRFPNCHELPCPTAMKQVGWGTWLCHWDSGVTTHPLTSPGPGFQMKDNTSLAEKLWTSCQLSLKSLEKKPYPSFRVIWLSVLILLRCLSDTLCIIPKFYL